MTDTTSQHIHAAIPVWLWDAPIEQVLRVDVGLEGNWSETVVPVWSRASGFAGFRQAATGHAEYRPALELALPGGWIGISCFRMCGDRKVLDEARARLLIKYVEVRQGA